MTTQSDKVKAFAQELVESGHIPENVAEMLIVAVEKLDEIKYEGISGIDCRTIADETLERLAQIVEGK